MILSVPSLLVKSESKNKVGHLVFIFISSMSSPGVFNGSNTAHLDKMAAWVARHVGETIAFDVAAPGPDPQWDSVEGVWTARTGGYVAVTQDGSSVPFPERKHLYKNDTRSRMS